MVSRSVYDSGIVDMNNYLCSMKRIWTYNDSSVSKTYSYAYEETTFDKKSEFTAEVVVTFCKCITFESKSNPPLKKTQKFDFFGI